MVRRLFRHVSTLPGAVARAFPAAAFASIERAISESESRHGGEIRFAVEASLHPMEILRRKSPRERALEVFSELRVWDTEKNNGVLLYLLLADHDVEIVADRGFNGRVDAQEWEAACRAMEARLREGSYEPAALEGIARIGALMARAFPDADADELPDRPFVA